MWNLVFAVDPVMDATVATALTGTVNGLQSTATGQLASILPIASIVLLSVVAIFFGLRMFRKVAHI
jgi:hypothetical protein